jgi:hypothetical protein
VPVPLPCAAAARVGESGVGLADRSCLRPRAAPTRQGPECAALYDAPDRGATPPAPPSFDSADAVAAAAGDPRGQLHARLLAALAGPDPESPAARHPRAPELRASVAGLERAAGLGAVEVRSVAQVLCALRLFSCG